MRGDGLAGIAVEALTQLVAQQDAEIERLQAAGDALAAHLADRIGSHWSASSYVLLGAWREARRG